MMSKLLEHDKDRVQKGLSALDLSSVRFHLSAGEALPPTLLERFRARFRSDDVEAARARQGPGAKGALGARSVQRPLPPLRRRGAPAHLARTLPRALPI